MGLRKVQNIWRGDRIHYVLQNVSADVHHNSAKQVVYCLLVVCLQKVAFRWKIAAPSSHARRALFEDVELALCGVNVGRLRETIAGCVCSETDRQVPELIEG